MAHNQQRATGNCSTCIISCCNSSQSSDYTRAAIPGGPLRARYHQAIHSHSYAVSLTKNHPKPDLHEGGEGIIHNSVLLPHTLLEELGHLLSLRKNSLHLLVT